MTDDYIQKDLFDEFQKRYDGDIKDIRCLLKDLKTSTNQTTTDSNKTTKEELDAQKKWLKEVEICQLKFQTKIKVVLYIMNTLLFPVVVYLIIKLIDQI